MDITEQYNQLYRLRAKRLNHVNNWKVNLLYRTWSRLHTIQQLALSTTRVQQYKYNAISIGGCYIRSPQFCYIKGQMKSRKGRITMMNSLLCCAEIKYCNLFTLFGWVDCAIHVYDAIMDYNNKCPSSYNFQIMT